MSVVDLGNKVVQKNNILLGHVFHNKHETFVRLENEGFRSHNPNIADIKSLWDTVTANYVGRLDQTTKVGIEVIFYVIFRVHGTSEAIISNTLKLSLRKSFLNKALT